MLVARRPKAVLVALAAALGLSGILAYSLRSTAPNVDIAFESAQFAGSRAQAMALMPAPCREGATNVPADMAFSTKSGDVTANFAVWRGAAGYDAMLFTVPQSFVFTSRGTSRGPVEESSHMQSIVIGAFIAPAVGIDYCAGADPGDFLGRPWVQTL